MMVEELKDNNINCKCGGRVITDEESGEEICSQCGIVVFDKAISPIPIRTENKAGDMEQHFGRMDQYKMMDTMIPDRNKDVNGAQIPTTVNHMMDRIRLFDKRIGNHRYRKAREYMRNLNSACDKLSVSDTFRARAKHLFVTAYEKHLFKGRSAISFVVGAIYLTYKENNRLRTIAELLDVIGHVTNVKSVRVAVKVMQHEMNIETPIIAPTSTINNMVSKLGVGPKTELKTMEILDTLKDNPLSTGKNPKCLAAGALSVALEITKEQFIGTQESIADAAGVTTVSLRKMRKFIHEQLKLGPLKDLRLPSSR